MTAHSIREAFADLRHHDGDLDYLGLMVGAYDEWLAPDPDEVSS